MQRVLSDLVERLTKTFGERLQSVILYGSGAGGDHHGKFSDYNVLCVLREITPRELEESNPIVRWWREKGNPAPVLLTEEEIHNSTDCFAIEFYDMCERRQVLHGADVIAAVKVDPRFYRAQVEHELRAKLLRLRTKAAGVLDQKTHLRMLMADSLSSFAVLFRHALRLAGVEASSEKRQIIVQAGERFGIDASPFLTLLELRQEKISARDIAPIPLLENYMRQIQVVIDAVDHLAK